MRSNDFDKILESLDKKIENKANASQEPNKTSYNAGYTGAYSELHKTSGEEARRVSEAQQNAFRQNALRQREQNAARQHEQDAFRQNAIRQQEQRRAAERTQQSRQGQPGEQQYQSPYKNGVYFSNQRPSTAQQSTGSIPVGGSAASTDEGNAKSRGSKSAKKKGSGRKRSSASGFKSVIPLLAVILVFTVLFSTFGIMCINDILAIGKKDAPVTVNIQENMSTNQIIDILDKEGLISQREFCKIFCSLTSKLKNTKTPVYLAGPYELNASMGLEGMLNELKGKQKNAETEKLIFPEGYSVYQIFDKLATYGVCKSDYLYSSIDTSNYKYGFISGLENSKACYKLEGYLFPDTYEFYIGENPISVIKRFLTAFESKWTEGCKQKAKELGLTTNEVIIIASIIQKEAANKSQMVGISSVIHNRLNDPVNYPTLDCDSTYEYVSKYLAPKIGDSAAAQYMPLYNTYKCEGLPAGAICNPGMDAIEAALNPAETDYYYFQHDKNGKIYYARNAAEQDQNSFEVARANSAE
ncbi:MAG: endolytic transglycosylase MltG [Clostridiales bacterium]|nr:endolytic transglycosylase MltG [Clostridiales bacterium]